MRLTKMGHACVRFENQGRVLVIDPGTFSSTDALAGADAVLVTHEHVDHLARDRIRSAAADNPSLRIWTNESAAKVLDGTSVQVVRDGDVFSIDGAFDVEVHGEWHAIVHQDVPRIPNTGFLVNGLVFHPGDAFVVPDRDVDTLMLPVSAPWMKIGEALDYVRTVKPRQAFPIHDAILSETGMNLVDGLFGARGPGIGSTSYRRPSAGEWIQFD